MTITIKIPYVRPSSAEIHVAGTDFSFYCKPYLLKLAFPHTVIDTSDGDACANNIDAVNNGSVSTHNGSSSNAEYDPNIDNGTLTIKLVKEEYGQFFEDLDLLTTLLVQQKDIGLPLSVMNSIGVNNDDTGKKMISVIDDDSSTEEQVGYCGEDTHNMGATDNLMSLLRPKYGFLQQHCNVFRDLREELRHEMIDLPDPDDTDQFSMRRSMRLMQELEGFDEDRYLGDYFGASEDMLYLEAKHMDVHWHSTHATSGQSIRSSNDISESQEIKEMTEAMHKLSTTTTNGFENCNQFFTQDERDLLLRLFNRDYGAIIAGASDETNLFLGLIDILYAYAYDYRMTIGDPSSESAWTIGKLSSTLSWLDSYDCKNEKPADVLRFGMRRSLIYPYLRYWNMARLVANDVVNIFKAGRRAVLRCLLTVYKIFETSDTHYMFNKLYIADYCVWIQKISETTLTKFECQLTKNCVLSITKESIDLDLLELEQLALSQEEEDESDTSVTSSDGEESDTDSDGHNSKVSGNENEERIMEGDGDRECEGSNTLQNRFLPHNGAKVSVASTVIDGSSLLQKTKSENNEGPHPLIKEIN